MIIEPQDPQEIKVGYHQTNETDDIVTSLRCSELGFWRAKHTNYLFNMIDQVDPQKLPLPMIKAAVGYNLAVVGVHDLSRALCDFYRYKRIQDTGGPSIDP